MTASFFIDAAKKARFKRCKRRNDQRRRWLTQRGSSPPDVAGKKIESLRSQPLVSHARPHSMHRQWLTSITQATSRTRMSNRIRGRGIWRSRLEKYLYDGVVIHRVPPFHVHENTVIAKY